MPVLQRILDQLIHTRNNAAERAIEPALAHCTPEEQSQLVDALLERNRRQGWVMLIRQFDKLHEVNRRKLVARPRDLFGPLAESMQESSGSSRENVIKIVKHCSDPRLVYLLAEALMDNRHEVRELAGQSLLETVRRYCDRSDPSLADASAQIEAMNQIRRAVDLALRRFRTHRQTAALHAALIYERQLDSSTWSLFHDTYDDLTRAATVTFRALPEPALAHALLLALGTPLKPAAMAGLAGIESPALAGAVVAQSYRLIDPHLREPARAVSHLKMIPALRKEMPWAGDAWAAWLRLIDSVGLQPAERLAWLSKMYEKIPQSPDAVGWRMQVIRALADTMLPDAGGIIALAIHDADERVSRFAARFLLTRRVADWRELAANNIPTCPHLSVRRLAAITRTPEAAAPALPARTIPAPAPRGFDKTWNEYQRMPPAVQLNTARTLAGDPAFAEQLRIKLQPGGAPHDIAQALKMLNALPNLAGFRSQVIALCGHRDARIAAMAVRLVGRLEDPRLRDLLEAATHHADPRVRANAIESMDDLHVAGQSQQVLAMLNSRHNRERANAIRAMGQFNFATARECLGKMLSDSNPLHRLSALWVVSQLELVNVMRQVGVMARKDPNMRVRKRAAEMITALNGHLQSLS